MTVTGAVLWGVNGTVSKILMDSYRVDPTWVACVREIVAGLLFLACAGAATPKLLGGMLRERKNYPMLVIVALSSVLVIQVGYLQAIHWTNAGTATVLQSLSLLFVLLYVCVHGRRLPTVIETIGVILAVIGTMLIATGGNLSSISLPLPGLAWGLVNALGNAAMAIIPLALIARWGAFSVKWRGIPDFRIRAGAVRAAMGPHAAVGCPWLADVGFSGGDRHVRGVWTVYGRRCDYRLDAWHSHRHH